MWRQVVEQRRAQEALGAPGGAERRVALGQQLGGGLERRLAGPGDPVHVARGLHGEVADVAGEVLVAAVAVEGDGDELARLARDEVGGQRRGVRVRLAVMPGELGQHVRHLRLHRELDVLGLVALGDQAGEAGLVEALLLEADGEGLHGAAGELRHQRDDDGGVHAAGEEGAQRHVGDHAQAHGLGQRVADEALGFLDVARDGTLPDGQVPVALHLVLAGAPGQDVAGRELGRGLVDGARGRDVLQGEEQVHRVRVHLAAQRGVQREQRAQFRAEDQPAARTLRVAERLLADAVARQQEPLLLLVPDGEGEHAAQRLDAALPHVLVEGEDGLGVGLRLELEASALQVLAQLPVVVDLAVEDDPVALVGVGDGLVAGVQVDDGQAAHGQAHAFAREEALVVGAAVGDEVVGPLEEGPIGRPPVRVHDAEYAAHGLSRF
jgi:hypothetical protein